MMNLSEFLVGRNHVETKKMLELRTYLEMIVE